MNRSDIMGFIGYKVMLRWAPELTLSFLVVNGKKEKKDRL